MYDLPFYLKRYECTLMSLFYLEIIHHTWIFLFIKKWMLHTSLAYMQLNQASPTDILPLMYNLGVHDH